MEYSLKITQNKQTKEKLQPNDIRTYFQNLLIVWRTRKGPGFHLILKIADLQIINYTTLSEVTVINVWYIHLHLHVPMLIPSPKTLSNFIKPIKISFTLSIHHWTMYRRVIDTQAECQLEITSVQKINPPKILIAAHQGAAKSAAPSKSTKTAFLRIRMLESTFQE